MTPSVSASGDISLGDATDDRQLRLHMNDGAETAILLRGGF